MAASTIQAWAEPRMALEAQSPEGLTRIEIPAEQYEEYEPFLRLSVEPTLAEFHAWRSSAMPASLDLLREIARSDPDLTVNAGGRRFAELYGRHNISLLRDFFWDHAATSIFQILLDDKNSIVRLMGRDMAPAFRVMEAFLHPDNQFSPIPREKRAALRKRVQLVTVSRKLAEAVVSPDKYHFLFDLTEDEVRKASRIHLVDLGLNGTIRERTRAAIQENELKEKISWRFFWKAPNAPADIEVFSNEYFNHSLQHIHGTFWNNFDLQAVSADSLRVLLLEHQGHWNQSSTAFRSDPVYLVLDLDDTLLKETDRTLAGRAGVQSITYQPNPEAYQRYRSRLEHPDPGKVVHFSLLDDGISIESFLTIRPSAAQMLNRLGPVIKTGEVVLLVASNNDELRTRAILDNVKFGESTLAELGARLLTHEEFRKEGTDRKSMARIRQMLQIPPTGALIGIDDRRIFEELLPIDNPIQVPPWGLEQSEAFIKGEKGAEDFAVKDELLFGKIGRIVREKFFQREPSLYEDRLRVLAHLLQISDGVLSARDVSLDPAGVEARAHPNLKFGGAGFNRGLIEHALFIHENLPLSVKMRVGRDALVMEFVFRLLGDRDFVPLEVSQFSRQHALFGEYTRQQTSPVVDKIQEDSRVRLMAMDVGYAGATVDHILAQLPIEVTHRGPKASFLAAYNSKYLGSYLALKSNGFEGELLADTDTIVRRFFWDGIESIPKPYTRVYNYLRVEGSVRPVFSSIVERSSLIDEAISPQKFIAHLEDLKAYFETPEIQELVKKRREQYRDLNKDFLSADKEKFEEGVELLKRYASDSSDPYGRALVMDYVELHLGKLTFSDVNLEVPRDRAHSLEPNLQDLIQRGIPGWLASLSAPAEVLPQASLRDLELLAGAVNDFEYKKALIERLKHFPQGPERDRVLEAILRRRDHSQSQIVDYVKCSGILAQVE